MANPIAEAFVLLRPDASVLAAQTQTAIRGALAGTNVSAASQAAIGRAIFGQTFRTNAAQLTSSAIAGARISAATQRTLAQNLFGPGFRNESGRAIQGILAGIGQGEIAARFAFFGPGGAALATVAAGLVLAGREAALFERSLDVLQRTAQATDAQMAELAEEAKRLGASVELPTVTAQAAADAMTEMVKAGISVKDTLAGVEGVLQLATAAQTDAATAARIVASALNAFGLAGTEAVRVADLLAGASIAASGDIGDMALAMQQAAAVADQAGLKVDQLVGFITLLAKQGILGSDAGTSIRTALLRLVPTTEEAAGFMEALGIQLDRTRTLGQQLPALLDQYHVALGALNPTLRQSVLQQIAGTDAIRALSVAVEAGGEGFKQTAIEADRQNAALELATAQTEGLAGATQGALSSAQTFALTLGEDLSPALQFTVEGLTGFFNALNDAQGAFDRFDRAATDFLADTLGPLEQGLEDAANAIADRDPLSRALGLGTDEGLRQQLIEDVKDTGQFLAEALDQAVQLRGELVELGLPTTKIDREIDDLRRQLRAIREETGTDIGLDLATPLEKAIENAEKLKEALEKQGLPTAAIEREIDLLTDSLRRGLVQAREQAAKDLAAREQLARALGFSAEEIARLMETVKTEGKAAGVELGRSFIDGMVGEITESEARAIDAARSTLNAVREEGARQVLDAIRSARGNLESLASSLSGMMEEIIDAGPIGREIAAIDEELDRLEESVSRRQLRFNLSQAQTDLRDMQQAIAQAGKLTPAQRKAQEEFLAPFEEKVADAKAAAQEFDLTEQREELELTRDAAVDAAEEGIQTLVASFEDGRISADEFERSLRNRLGPAFDILKTKAGRNLGLVFTRDFKRDVEALVAQAEALAGFLGRAGTTPGPQVVRPAETQTEVNQRIATALENLEQVQDDALEVTKDESDKLTIQIALLRQLVRLMGGSPKSRPTRDPRVSGRDD